MNNNIDYTKIDEKCIPMVKFFNSIGLITKYSCQGHDNKLKNSFYIIFADEIKDEDIILFLKKYSNVYDHTPFTGKFVKWSRKLSGNIVFNWMYNVDYGDFEFNQVLAFSDFKKMEKEIA